MRRISSKNGISLAEQGGSVIVELALMLPLLAMLVLGATDLGMIVREHQLLQNAAREGARFSAQPKSHIDSSNPPPADGSWGTPESIRNRVINYLAQEKITVTASGDCVQPDPAVPEWNCALTNGGNIAIRQQYPIPIVVGCPPDEVCVDHGSSVSVTYTRSFLFSGGSLFQFNSVSLNGNSVFHNLY